MPGPLGLHQICWRNWWPRESRQQRPRPMMNMSITRKNCPRVGDLDVVLDGQGQAVAIIETTKVTVLPFRDVSADHAYKEGEGDRSLAYWRQVHEELFTKWLAGIGLSFSPASKVVLEEFQLVYKVGQEPN